MESQLVILEAMPSAVEFYGQYWNRRAFVVRGAIAADVIDGLIAADELAGLAMEQAPMSRMVKAAGEGRQWSCRFGPFTEQDFKDAGDEDWSLLVQNVEQFHPPTAVLLRHFNVAPRWLMDDIMVSYSGKGGTVGPHIDSYHVFLVQGQGRRRWKIGLEAIAHEVFIEGLDLKVLEADFDSDEVEVRCGDVLYLPPKFAHQGMTLEPSLTFSVGFLGPKLSQLFGAYGQYLSEHEDLDQRFVAEGLDGGSAGFALASAVVEGVRKSLTGQVQSLDFSRWLAAFFTESGHEDFGNYEEREQTVSIVEFKAKLKMGATLIKPDYVKFALTEAAPDQFILGFDGQSFILEQGQLPIIQTLMNEQAVIASSVRELLNHPATLELLGALYNHQGLEFT